MPLTDLHIQGRGVLLTVSVSYGAFVSQPEKYIATGVRKAVLSDTKHCLYARTHTTLLQLFWRELAKRQFNVPLACHQSRGLCLLSKHGPDSLQI